MLAYCFCIRVNEADYGEVQAQVPSAIVEDIIADVELMKGQSEALGERFQVYEDVCISYGGMAMSTGRTFDIEDSNRPPSSNFNLNNCVQVTLIHEQIPQLSIEDNVSDTDPDWENQIDVRPLHEQTLQKKKP